VAIVATTVVIFILLAYLYTSDVNAANAYIFLSSAIVGWVLLIVLALLGAFFIGMLVGYRVLVVGKFTPFEISMMETKEDVRRLARSLEDLTCKLGAEDTDVKHVTPTEDVEDDE